MVLFRVGVEKPSSSLEIFGLFFSSRFSSTNVLFFSFFVLIFVNSFS